MRILVVGGDAAGMSAASQIRRRQPSWTVEVFEIGPRTSYALCGLPYYLGGLIPRIDDLVVLTPEQFERDRGIKVHIGHEVVALNPASKSLTVKNLTTGETRKENYDRLMLATGAEPIMPKGLEPTLPGIFYLRSLDEAAAIREAMKTARRAAVIGAGYIGLEVTENLVEAGLAVTLIGRNAAPIFEPELQNMAALTLARPGVEFRASTDALGVRPDPSGSGLIVETSQGEPVIADLVIVGTGVKPRSELAREAGLSLGAKGAVKVDRHQRTSNPFIYAAGDCAESCHIVSKKGIYIALALVANRQGRVAGMNIAGDQEKSPGILGTSVMKVFDLALARTGLGLEEATENGFREAAKTTIKQPSKPHYYPGSSEVTVSVIYDKVTGRLLGGQIAGSLEGVGQRINTLAAAITAGLTVKETADLDTAYAPPFSPVYDPVVIACEVAAKNLK